MVKIPSAVIFHSQVPDVPLAITSGESFKKLNNWEVETFFCKCGTGPEYSVLNTLIVLTAAAQSNFWKLTTMKLIIKKANPSLIIFFIYNIFPFIQTSAFIKLYFSEQSKIVYVLYPLFDFFQHV